MHSNLENMAEEKSYSNYSDDEKQFKNSDPSFRTVSDSADECSEAVSEMNMRCSPKSTEDEEEERFMRMNLPAVEPKGKYSSCSTVYAEHTIVNPDYDQVLFW